MTAGARTRAAAPPGQAATGGDGRPRRVCLVRFHDGLHKVNWGGRGTSLALARIVGDQPGYELATTVAGTAIVTGFGEAGTMDQVVRASSALARRARRATHRPSPDDRHARRQIETFGQARATAAVLLAAPRPGNRLRPVLEAIAEADEVWVNGEGDFILGRRPTLLRTLILIHMADLQGKPVRNLNSILSETATGEVLDPVRDAVHEALARCTSITYRDPTSLELHERLFGDLDASWAPDALFAWSPEGRAIVESPAAAHRYGPATESLGIPVQQLLASGRPFVAFSGSSARRDPNDPVPERTVRDLIRGFRANGLDTVVLATDVGDDWLAPIARSEGSFTVDARVPLAAGMSVLARAQAYLSGRYHPSILATTVGTPVTLMASNSHKTTSLQRVLGADDPTVAPFLDPAHTGALVDAVVERAGSAELDRPDRLDLADRLASRAIADLLPATR